MSRIRVGSLIASIVRTRYFPVYSEVAAAAERYNSFNKFPQDVAIAHGCIKDQDQYKSFATQERPLHQSLSFRQAGKCKVIFIF